MELVFCVYPHLQTSLLCRLTGAERPQHFHRQPPGGDEGSGQKSGGAGTSGSRAGEEPERLQAWFIALFC